MPHSQWHRFYTEWWGTVTGFQRPGSIDFHHTIRIRQLRATVDVRMAAVKQYAEAHASDGVRGPAS